MRALIIILLSVLLSSASTGQVLVFQHNDERMKVYYGDTVTIKADSAYIISQAQALMINERLKALQEAQYINAHYYEQQVAIRAKINQIVLQVERLSAQLLLDNQLIESHLVLLIHDLDKSIAMIKQNNTELGATNDDLKAQLAHLDVTVKRLRKESKHLRWKHVKHTVGVGIGALVVGFMVGVVI